MINISSAIKMFPDFSLETSDDRDTVGFYNSHGEAVGEIYRNGRKFTQRIPGPDREMWESASFPSFRKAIVNFREYFDANPEIIFGYNGIDCRYMPCVECES